MSRESYPVYTYRVSEPLRVALFRYHLPVVTAIGAGLFTTAGVDPAFEVVRSSAQQRELLESGAADIAHTAVDNVAAWHSPAFGWAVLRVVDLGLPHRLVALPRYARLADLSGRRIAVDSAASGFVTLLRVILGSQKLANAPEFVEVGALQQRLDALTAGTVDACLLGGEQLASALAAGASVLLTLNDYFPEYPGLVVSGLPPHVAARSEPIARYVATLCDSAAWCFEPARSAEVRALVRDVLGVSTDEAAAWYEAELLRRTATAPPDGQWQLLTAAWRASGRLAADQAPPRGWYQPEALTASAGAAADGAPDAAAARAARSS